MSAKLVLLLGAMLTMNWWAASASEVGEAAKPVAYKARQVAEMIDWFYVQHRACPQPSSPADLRAMERDLGDGYSVERGAWFSTIRGISMRAPWRYYTNPRHAKRCLLWRELGLDQVLVWSRDGGSARWLVVP